MYVAGFDIGGTKCAVITAQCEGDAITLEQKAVCPTDHSISPAAMIDRMMDMADGLLKRKPDAIGISCGGPLDSRKGIICSPPNLPGWDSVPIVAQMQARYGVPVRLQNDANACALAEWKYGAGKGCENMIFMTFGTGMGGGLILNGRLYAGTNDNAGEIGHLRLDRLGPAGYGKTGSFEGFCSGGGLAQLGYTMAVEQLQRGVCPAYFAPHMTAADVTAKTVGDAAEAGDETALAVYRTCGEYLGRGLALLVDVLNPECIVIGSIFARSRDLLWPAAERVLRQEALPGAVACCRVVPAQLGEHIGDYAACVTAVV